MAREELHHCTTKHADRGTGRLHMPQTTNIQKRVPHDGVARNMQMLFHCSDGNGQLVFCLDLVTSESTVPSTSPHRNLSNNLKDKPYLKSS